MSKKKGKKRSGSGNGHKGMGGTELDALLRDLNRQAESETDGAASQEGAFDHITLDGGELVRTLRESASQADSIASSGEELASSSNELAASIEQMSGGAAGVATAIA